MIEGFISLLFLQAEFDLKYLNSRVFDPQAVTDPAPAIVQPPYTSSLSYFPYKTRHSTIQEKKVHSTLPQLYAAMKQSTEDFTTRVLLFVHLSKTQHKQEEQGRYNVLLEKFEYFSVLFIFTTEKLYYDLFVSAGNICKLSCIIYFRKHIYVHFANVNLNNETEKKGSISVFATFHRTR